MVAADTERVEVNSGNTVNFRNPSSIYSLTLDEFQNTVCESGNAKNFGSMNMDEFLANIWTAEDTQNHIPTLSRQGSLSLPAPLSRKTVDEVWSDIQRGGGGVVSEPAHHRQNTFGEMTLEDFLVKAGVVRDANPPPMTPQLAPPEAMVPFGYTFGVTPLRNDGYVAVPPPGVCYGNGIGIGFGMASPVSSLGSDGMDVEVLRPRKRTFDGPVEKVVERRQRRMIKNRESAARSRARKQAFTIELEAELNELREENTQLKQALAELEKIQKLKQIVEEQPRMPRSRAHKAHDRPGDLRRIKSCKF